MFCLFSSEPKQCKNSHLRQVLLSEMQRASMQKINLYVERQTDRQTDSIGVWFQRSPQGLTVGIKATRKHNTMKRRDSSGSLLQCDHFYQNLAKVGQQNALLW